MSTLLEPSVPPIVPVAREEKLFAGSSTRERYLSTDLGEEARKEVGA